MQSDDNVPQIFRGIRKYIKKCYETEYAEDPDYPKLRKLLENAFAMDEEENHEMLLRDIAMNILETIIVRIINEIIH